MVMQDNQFQGPDEGLAAFKKVLMDPQGQAVVIAGPPGSGKRALLEQMLETAREHHSYDVERAYVESVVIGPDQSIEAVLVTVSGNQSRGDPITNADEYLKLLHDRARGIGEKQRIVIGVNADEGLPPNSRHVWFQILEGLPGRVKMIFTQPLNDVLSNSREFVTLPNVKFVWLSRPTAEEDSENTRRDRQRSKRDKTGEDAVNEDRFWRSHKRLTNAPKEILQGAMSLAREKPNRALPLTTSCLLFAMADSGRSDEEEFDSARFFLDFLNRRISPVLLPSLRERYFQMNVDARYPWPGVPVRNFGDVATFVIDLLERAAEFARQTTQGGEIHVRHLLAALVLFRPEQYETGARGLLRRMGVDEPILRALPSHLQRFREDNQDAWASILKASRGEPLPTPLTLLSNDGLRDVTDRLVDQLDVENEVNAFSTVIAACKAQPPISIGLFGDWGSGKSFFMDMMCDRINEIQQWARTWGDRHRGEKPDFCTDIVQIRFNAWHYVDQNLWAGLVTHIFDELAAVVSKRTKGTLERTKEQLLQNTELAGEQLKEAQAEERQAVELKGKAEAALNVLVEQRDVASANLANIRVEDVIGLAKNDPRVKDNLREVANRLGIPKEKATIDELWATVQESREVFGRIRRVRKGIASQKNGKWKLLLYTLLLTISPVVVGFIFFRVLPEDWWSGLGGVVSMTAAFVTEFLAVVRPRLKVISAGLNQWAKTQEQIQTIAAEMSREEMKLQDEVRRLQDQENEARKRVIEAEQRLQKARSELDDIRTGRRLYRFIEERSRRAEYKSQLGIITVIRRDFEGLQNLVQESARSLAESLQDERASTGTDLKDNDDELRIDRIVLYIDDLDRCPSQRVVEVLQAVHLLLAFKLFVVVVGVDPRWILHALREEYTAFGADQRTSILGHRWLTTPQNYVEKIFQIPFALRPMADDGYRNLVMSLVNTDLGAAGAADSSASERTMTSKKTATGGEGDASRGGQKPSRSVQQRHPSTSMSNDESREERQDGHARDPEVGSQEGGVPETRPAALVISRREVEFMSELANFVRSPRATKRLVNVYRLIRATIRTDQELAYFEGRNGENGEYQAVLLMLAILTRFPDQAAGILRTLANNPTDSGNLGDFVQALKTHTARESEPPTQPDTANDPTTSAENPKATESEAPAYSNIIHRRMSEAEAITWDKLSDFLYAECSRLNMTNSLAPFVHWAGCVARFSFQYEQNAL